MSAMTDETSRTPWPFAMHVAEKIISELAPFCDHVEIAGSLRRRRETVKDIEILAIPRLGPQPTDLFKQPFGIRDDYLMNYLATALNMPAPMWTLRPSKVGGTSFGNLNKLLVYRSGLPQCPEIAVDVFTGTVENWGRDLWIRTGPAAWNTACAARAQVMGMQMHAYGPSSFTRDSLPVCCPTEEDFARVLEITPPPPTARTDEAAKSLYLRRQA